MNNKDESQKPIGFGIPSPGLSHSNFSLIHVTSSPNTPDCSQGLFSALTPGLIGATCPLVHISALQPTSIYFFKILRPWNVSKHCPFQTRHSKPDFYTSKH